MATSSCHLVDSSGYPWRPRLSVGCGCSAGMEQSATRDSGVLLTFNILKGDQVSPFSSVIRLTWRCPFRPSADVCIELCNSFRCKFCKVPPQLCDGSTIILTSLVVVVVVVALAVAVAAAVVAVVVVVVVCSNK